MFFVIKVLMVLFFCLSYLLCLLRVLPLFPVLEAEVENIGRFFNFLFFILAILFLMAILYQCLFVFLFCLKLGFIVIVFSSKYL